MWQQQGVFTVLPFAFRDTVVWTISAKGRMHGSGKSIEYIIRVADNFSPDSLRKSGYDTSGIAVDLSKIRLSMSLQELDATTTAIAELTNTLMSAIQYPGSEVSFIADQLLLWDYMPSRRNGDDRPGVIQDFAWNKLTNYQSREQAKAAGMPDEFLLNLDY